ncbi:PREDICTED: laminin subunit gamma-1-like [Nicrophorus vespilloides]|uniref:Laminin subunit gamma-1-like n=1 Tax=Nicrophorus vespilloides TaxID=110193 RepID=A0ABM1M8X3_NICVS|nr:PREDICTED: laminin subunit gamma-1-like [Nicrophorus vespilloides]
MRIVFLLIFLVPAKGFQRLENVRHLIPKFEQIAHGKLIQATNTCNGSIFCMLKNETCDICNERDHSSKYLTDGQSNTYWQSQTMEHDVQYPNQIHLTLNFNKAYDIIYVSLWFKSPRPESFAIYKKVCESCPWVPYQYFSATCQETYGVQDSTAVKKGVQEARALCTSSYSDISPLSGERVIFSAQKYRPSNTDINTSPELQDWITATDIRISLDRLNTFQDERFKDIWVLRRYYYSIISVEIGAHCKCNGHASKCIPIRRNSDKLVCDCKHNTYGDDCEKCLPYYNDVPWKRATDMHVNECKACNCNGYSNSCFFDEELYRQTGHGGHCMECSGNRSGPNCDYCKVDYYQLETGECRSCNCDPIGSYSSQCNTNGYCSCKAGVAGQKCDKCKENHYNFGNRGCESCNCNVYGSLDNIPRCDPETGVCKCKQNVEGMRCSECKLGFFNLESDNIFGCTACFCYGHSSSCHSSNSYSKYQYEAQFTKSNERWKAINSYGETVSLKYDSKNRSISASSKGDDVYFVSSDRFTGDQRASYGQHLYFTLRISDNVRSTSSDLVLEGGDGSSVATKIFSQQNKLPTTKSQNYKFRLMEDSSLDWTPKLSAKQFISILSNLTAIKIKASYSGSGTGYLEDFKLETALSGIAGEKASWIEHCDCVSGYVGQFCESCAPGFTHSSRLGSPLLPCKKCDCHEHADNCDPISGNCYCNHNTVGTNCEKCARGFYGNAVMGTENDCSSCGCPYGGACIVDDDDIKCIECPKGYGGRRCDVCLDGYFGEPPTELCQKCDCNLNIDNDAVGNCDTKTGKCLKCIYNTGGAYCEECLPGYYGDALSLPKGDCKECECSSEGTVKIDDGSLMCDQISGMCKCQPNVYGRNCDKCEEGYYDLIEDEGCKPCNCNTVGSIDHTCDLHSGRCHCQPGVTGLRCDRCQENKYKFSSRGCQDCECDDLGSISLQCDSSGQCPCLENVEGRRCDQCKENKYDRSEGCKDCPQCYNMVQEAYWENKKKLQELTEMLNELEERALVVGDKQFEANLRQIQIEAIHLKENANALNDDNIQEEMAVLVEKQKTISMLLIKIEDSINMAKYQNGLATTTFVDIHNNVKRTKETINVCFEKIGKVSLRNYFGDQSERLKKTLQQNRELIKNITTISDKIYNTALEAQTKSDEAYKLAKSSTDMKKGFQQELHSLNGDIANKFNTFEKYNEGAIEAQNEWKDITSLNLQLLAEVKTLHKEIPVADFRGITEDAKHMLDDSEEILINMNNLDDININDFEQITDSKKILLKATEYTNDLNELIFKIEQYAIKTFNAVDLCAKVFSKATETYNAISDFNKNLTNTRTIAESSLNKMPYIENLLSYVQDLLIKIGPKFHKIKVKSDKAIRGAKDTIKSADDVMKEMQEVSVDLEALFIEVSHLHERALEVNKQLEEVKEKFMKIHGDKVNNQLITEIKASVEYSEISTEEAARLVDDMSRKIVDIWSNISDLPEVEDLDPVRKRLDYIEKQIKQNKIENILDKFEKEKKDNDDLIEMYTQRLNSYTEEVQQLKNIAMAIPDGCFRNIALEP